MREVRSQDWSSREWVPYERDPKEFPRPFGHPGTRTLAFTGHRGWMHLDLGIPGLQNRENKCPLFKPSGLRSLCYSSLNKLRRLQAIPQVTWKWSSATEITSGFSCCPSPPKTDTDLLSFPRLKLPLEGRCPTNRFWGVQQPSSLQKQGTEFFHILRSATLSAAGSEKCHQGSGMDPLLPG